MKKLVIYLTLSTAVLFAACNEEDEVVPGADYVTPAFNVTAESVITTDAAIEDVVEAADYEADLYTGTFDILDDLSAEAMSDDQLKSSTERFRDRYRIGRPDITIEWTDGDYPRTVTLDYGEETELANGRIISGIIQIEVSAPLYTDSATRTITFTDFSVDSLIINGTIEKEYGVTEKEVFIVRDLTITLPDGLEIDCYAEVTRSWTEGMDTPFYHADDVLEITGYSNCTDSEGNEYRREITESLKKKGSCRFLVSGEVSYSVNGQVFGTVDYGDGTCDNIGYYTTSEGTKEFNIGRRIRMRLNN
ncbi:hypothetical protein [Thermophagus xiamenensis]|uniref:Uncharacterized protein n=1 Tax=Thermophagus xiamenensis TaxID=385682 RepID=A0A1I2FES4_9BACT|nr:hypothetical protein [Thermophagus xiamenensis]SFF03399.1 hypothetical protein SAMN05444380_12818 [Thermophagus xiamenensis]